VKQLKESLYNAAKEARLRGDYDVAALLEELAYQAGTGKIYPAFIKGWPYR
jgi:hypothetical protein